MTFAAGPPDFPGLTAADVTRMPSVGPDYRAGFLAYQYNWKLAKLYAAILGYPTASYADVYTQTEAFSAHSDTCKLNLYPIAFRNTDEGLWQEWLYERTGLPTKALYLAWCQLNRFPRFAERTRERRPKAIVCTGLQFAKHFLMAFAGIESAFQPMTRCPSSPDPVHWAPVGDGDTCLFVTPFLGQGGLRSDAQIASVGKAINATCREHFGTEWCRHLTETNDAPSDVGLPAA